MANREMKGLTLKTPEALPSPWSSGEPSLNGFNTPWTNIRWHNSFASSSADPPPWFMHSLSNRVRPENRGEMNEWKWPGESWAPFSMWGRMLRLYILNLDCSIFRYHEELKGDVSLSDVIIKHLNLQALFTPFTCVWQERCDVLIVQHKELPNHFRMHLKTASRQVNLLWPKSVFWLEKQRKHTQLNLVVAGLVHSQFEYNKVGEKQVPEQLWIWDKEESSFLKMAGVELVTRDGKYIDINKGCEAWKKIQLCYFRRTNPAVVCNIVKLTWYLFQPCDSRDRTQ